MTAIAPRLIFALHLDTLLASAVAWVGVDLYIDHDQTCAGFFDYERRKGEVWVFGVHVMYSKLVVGRV